MLDLHRPELQVIVEPFRLILLAFEADAELPQSAKQALYKPVKEFYSLQRTSSEISILCVPEQANLIMSELTVKAKQQTLGSDEDRRPWRVIRIRGPMDLTMASSDYLDELIMVSADLLQQTGVMASFATALANANIALLAQSTYLTDYVLVRQDELDSALAALAKAGWSVAK
ncbi:hypothetical protein EMMF5_001046 [Cystobasidiomycetes sp. EMM_F5]